MTSRFILKQVDYLLSISITCQKSRSHNLIVKQKHDFKPISARILFGLFTKTIYLRIVNVQLFSTKVMNLFRVHGVCCEIRHDLGISLLSIQWFTSGQVRLCWPGRVFFAIDPNILQWKVGQAAGHIARNAVTDVFHLQVPKREANESCRLFNKTHVRQKRRKNFQVWHVCIQHCILGNIISTKQFCCYFDVW